MNILIKKYLNIFKYLLCTDPHTLRESVSPVYGIFLVGLKI